MGYISTYASHKILDFILGGKTITPPTKYELALSTTPLGVDGINLTEPTDTAYKRLSIPNNKLNFTLAENKQLKNVNEMTFEESVEDWGDVVAFVLFDNLGNVWSYGNFAEAIATQEESSITLDPESIVITLDICGGSSSDMFITTAWANKLLDYFFGGKTFALPSDYYVELSLTATNSEGNGVTKPNSPEYKRLKVPNDKDSFTLATNKSVTFKKDFKFEKAQVSWGDIKHFCIYDSETARNVLWGGKLTNSRITQIGTTLVIKPDGFVWYLANCEE